MNTSSTEYRDLSLALLPPLLVRLIDDGVESALTRLSMLAVAFVVAHAWRAVFAGGQLGLKPDAAQFAFALLFTVMLPAPVGWGGAVLATSFGWVFAREVFGGEAILPPALVALAFAIFSFPQAGFEARLIWAQAPDWWLALACAPGVAWLTWRRFLAWQSMAGAFIGASVASMLADAVTAPTWWEHFGIGSFVIGIAFFAASPGGAPQYAPARWLHGAAIGMLVVAIRLFDPAQPDGVVFAALLGALFAPLLDRATSWSPRRG